MKQPVIEPINGKGHRYRLADNYHYQWGHDGKNFSLLIYAGFEFDGASIPIVCWSLIGLSPAHPKILAGALVHDLFYACRGRLSKYYLCSITDHSHDVLGRARNHTYFFDKRYADWLFDKINKENGMDRVRRFLVYNAVKLFGRY